MTFGFSTDGGRNLGATDLSSILNTLVGSSILDNVTLSQVLNLIDTRTDNLFDIGDLFEGLTGLIGSNSNSFTDQLDQLLDNVLGTSAPGSSLEEVLKDVSTALAGVDVSNLFGALDRDYYSLLAGISLDDLLSGLDRLDPALNLGSTDVLDGLGDILNQLGRTRLLDGVTLNDLIRGDAAANVLNGLSTNDLLLGFAGNDRLLGDLGADLLNGGIGADVVRGFNGNDILVGLADRDDLNGGRGKDILWGGAGADRYIGDRGSDYFVLDYKTGLDTILDFTVADILVLPQQLDLSDLRLSERGNDTLLSLGRTAIGLLKGVSAEELSSANVINLEGIG